MLCIVYCVLYIIKDIFYMGGLWILYYTLLDLLDITTGITLLHITYYILEITY